MVQQLAEAVTYPSVVALIDQSAEQAGEWITRNSLRTR
jgi:hypothetical protein